MKKKIFPTISKKSESSEHKQEQEDKYSLN